MAKLIMVCWKTEKQATHFRNRISLMAEKLLPDNIVPSPVKIIENDGIIFGIFNPNDATAIHDNRSVCLGSMFEETEWWEPKQQYPDGSYALFRSNSEYVEIVSDVVASRTIWYCKTGDLFIASTSQRAIINFLGTYEFNKKVIPWVLSTGTLGPGHSWDRRINCLKGDSSLLLKRSTWRLSKREGRVEFTAGEAPDHEHHKLLREALETTFDAMKLDFSQWVLPLSGGYDSRAILSLINDKNSLRTITWGLKESRFEKGNDGYIAKLLADYYAIENSYYELREINELSESRLNTNFNRFITCGDGRIDHIAAYMDDFQLWKSLHNDGITGLIRGDELFGGKTVGSADLVRYTISFPLWTDYQNVRSLEEFDIAVQEWPDDWHRKENETLETWRDRLDHQIGIPYVYSALADLKLPYLELICPLLSRKIIFQMRRLPDHLRTNRKLFTEIVCSIDPTGIEYEKYRALEEFDSIIKQAPVVNHLTGELGAGKAASFLPKELINYILTNVTVAEKTGKPRKKTAVDILRPFVPARLRKKIGKAIGSKSRIKPSMDFNVLALRAYLIVKTNESFARDLGGIS